MLYNFHSTTLQKQSLVFVQSYFLYNDYPKLSQCNILVRDRAHMTLTSSSYLKLQQTLPNLQNYKKPWLAQTCYNQLCEHNEPLRFCRDRNFSISAETQWFARVHTEKISSVSEPLDYKATCLASPKIKFKTKITKQNPRTLFSKLRVFPFREMLLPFLHFRTGCIDPSLEKRHPPNIAI